MGGICAEEDGISILGLLLYILIFFLSGAAFVNGEIWEHFQ
jgi:hypothetical protein